MEKSEKGKKDRLNIAQGNPKKGYCCYCCLFFFLRRTVALSVEIGGAGGKGTWGVGGLDDLKTKTLDPGDPNYDSEGEQTEEVILEETPVPSPFLPLLNEYLVSGDQEELARSLKELKLDELHSQFVKKGLLLAMEKQPFERELVSQLWSKLYGTVLSSTQIADGFQLALNSLDDSSLDTPDAVDVLAKFLARAILDEVIPPIFLQTAIVTNSLTKECTGLANVLLNEKNRGKKLEHVWGPGDLHSVKHLKEEYAQMLREFLLNSDQKEADRLLRQLNAPHFHFHFVKEAIRMALQQDGKQQQSILELLSSFSQSGLVSGDQIEKGFNLCYKSLEDLKLDTPNAPALLNSFVEIAKKGGWLRVDFDQNAFQEENKE